MPNDHARQREHALEIDERSRPARIRRLARGRDGGGSSCRSGAAPRGVRRVRPRRARRRRAASASRSIISSGTSSPAIRNGFDVATGHSLPQWNRSVYLLHADLSASCRLVWYGRRVRAWIDVSNSPQVPFFRPLIALFTSAGTRCPSRRGSTRRPPSSSRCTASSTTSSGRGTGAPERSGRRVRWRVGCTRSAATQGAPDSTSRSRTPRTSCRWSLVRSGIPSSYAFDYEFARVQHGFGSRAARRVVVPEAIPQEPPRRPRRKHQEGSPVPGAEGGVLPPRVHARRRCPRPARAGSHTHDRRRANASRRLAVPPRGEPAVRRRSRAPRARPSGRTPSFFHGRPISARRSPRERCPRSTCPSGRSTLRASSRSPTSSCPPAAR